MGSSWVKGRCLPGPDCPRPEWSPCPRWPESLSECFDARASSPLGRGTLGSVTKIATPATGSLMVAWTMRDADAKSAETTTGPTNPPNQDEGRRDNAAGAGQRGDGGVNRLSRRDAGVQPAERWKRCAGDESDTI